MKQRDSKKAILPVSIGTYESYHVCELLSAGLFKLYKAAVMLALKEK